MIEIKIDGKKFSAKESETILQVANRNNIHIPTLCYAEWAEPYGGCRICSVEITKDSWDGWKKVVTACNYPVQEGLIVYTKSEEIINIRKNLLDLLLARCPNTKAVQDLAEEYDILETSYVKRENPDDCILCGLCVRACEAIGANAISMINRGETKEVNTPFMEKADACIGCASCYNVCPTKHIKMEQDGKIRKIWNKEFEMLQCKECGKAIITKYQMLHFVRKTGLPKEYFEKCDECHYKDTAKKFLNITK